VPDTPTTRYAKTGDGVHIAYQVFGEGAFDLVFMPLGATNVELAWELPSFAHVFRRFASFSRLIRFDMRGSGLSDPFNLSERPSLEQQAAEMFSVLDATGSERAALAANGLGGLLAVFFAATYPQRVSSLVLHGCTARIAWAPDYPWGVPKEVLDRAVARIPTEEHAALKSVAPKSLRDPQLVSRKAEAP
jgi:pimeloyl-ACP methyl ester carboxylesterase